MDSFGRGGEALRRWALRRRDLAVPLSARRNGCVLIDQFPTVLPPFETVGLPGHDVPGGTALEHDVGALDRADDAHVPVDRRVQLQDVDLARLEVAESLVEQLPRRRDTTRCERGDVEPQNVRCPVTGALRTGHRLGHLANDGDDGFLVLLYRRHGLAPFAWRFRLTALKEASAMPPWEMQEPHFDL